MPPADFFLAGAKVINVSADNSPEANNALKKQKPNISGLSAGTLAARPLTQLENFF